MPERNQLLKALAALILVVIIGTAGYMVIEHWNLLEAFYMTIITLSTVGYGEVRTLSTVGRVFSVILIVSGVGVMLYALSTMVEYFTQGVIGNIFGRRRMKEKISKLKGHFIICGYGRVGQAVATTFKEENVDFIIIEPEKALLELAANNGFLYLEGDATSDETLRHGGVEQAHGLVAATGSDATNIYIILSARELAPEIFIISRAGSEESESKLKRAGANRIINPFHSAGERMARLAIYPLVSDFIETAFRSLGEGLVLEDIGVLPTSILLGKTINEAQEYSGGASILAIKKSAGMVSPRPAGKTIIELGDRLVALGTREQLRLIEEIDSKKE